jgi:hypothetical protein
MGWLSGHEPQLRIMIETFKRKNGEGLGANKVGEGNGENIPVWSLQGGKFGFRAREKSWFVLGGRGSGGWSRESAGGQFARCSPSRAQYGDGRSRIFEMERRDNPRFSFRGFGPPLGREGCFFSDWLPGWCSWR